MKNTLPVTRYYGSKRKIINNIWAFIEKNEIQFDSVLDIFGGTGIFSYKAKSEGKRVIYNDIFKFNSIIGSALIENKNIKLTEEDVEYLLTKHDNINYKYIITQNYKDIYYTDKENEQIDITCQNIQHISDKYKKALSFYLLFQSCLIKRPFNLFHRKNLYLRMNDVKRCFGNKKTWEKTFPELFRKFFNELNLYVFDNNKKNLSLNKSALNCKNTADLVYIDPPYISKEGSHVTYHSRYHFLEGLANYDKIIDNIDYNKKNLELTINRSKEFESKADFADDLSKLINKHQNKTIVLSYRNNGIPSKDEIIELFNKFNKKGLG